MEIKGALQPVIKPLSYEYNGMTGIEETLLFENGCIDFLPENEEQIGLYFDTYGCVSFSFNNAIETLVRRKIELGLFSLKNIIWINKNLCINGIPNFSDRDLVVSSGTNPSLGNDGWTVFETARDKGLICETEAPWNFREMNPSLNNKPLYYTYTRSNKSEELAKEFLKRFEVKAEWVNREDWPEASKYGVLQVYTKAWYERNGKYYNPIPNSSGHAIELCRALEHKIFDQYEPFIKEMERDEDFYPYALKINIFEKTNMKPTLKNNTLIMMVTGGGNIGMYLDNKIIVDEPAKLLAVWFARSSKNGAFTGGLVQSLTGEQWDMFPKTNLKGETV
jgi:hypothetical protein